MPAPSAHPNSRAIIALAYAAFARLYNRADIVVGVELSYRSNSKAREFIGLLARPLPMILNVDREMAIADLVHEVEASRARNYPHRRYPIQELARDLEITRKGQHGLFDVIVNYIPGAYDFAFEGHPVELMTLSNGFATPWLVTIADWNSAGDLDVSIDTDPGLIDPNMAARLAASLEILLQRGLDDPTCPLSALPIMPDVASAQVLAFAAGKIVGLPERETLASLCFEQAKRTPNAVALRYEEQQLSFAILHERALWLAFRLAALGVKPGVIVGIALPRTPSLLIAVLAVHKAGGAYLALDPSYPSERIRFMVQDSVVPVIVTTSELAPTFDDSGARLIIDTEQAEGKRGDITFVTPDPTDLAYVLYTSGSTGRPKAVGISHRNLINLICWGRSVVSDEELGGLLFSTSLNFDLSAFEIFLPLAFGGCVVMVENLLALQAAPQRAKVRLINSGPSLLDALLRAEAMPCGVTTVILAGEKMTRRLANALFAVAPNTRLINCYGPTETTVYSSGAVVDRNDSSDPTIGRPIWNTTFLVLDAGQALVPPGAEGELYIGGAGVAHGYVGRPELTSERFVPNPYCEGIIYRTGDRVRWLTSGELEFLGRADDQLKINGIRVEPGEIEATLLAQPGIANAVVTLYEELGGARRLTAYLVAKHGAAPATDQVRAGVERQLPRNMVPSVFVWLDKMPMTPNGKLDRKALPPPQREDPQPVHDLLQQTSLECEIAEIWEELLRRSPISARADFFDLGGDSLALLSLFATIEARYGRRLTVDVLSEGLTIAGLAQLLAKDAPRDGTGPIVTLQPHGDLPPFFCVHGIAGEVMHLHRLAVHMGQRRPIFGIHQPANSPPPNSLGDLAASYVAAIRQHQPDGPYYLGGHSFGATVAYEMAVQLLSLGCEVGLLAIIDQRKPGWRLTFHEALPVLHRILFAIPGRIHDEWSDNPPVERIGSLGRTLVRWSGAALGYRANAAYVFNINRDETKLLSKFEANLKSLRAYRPKKLSAPMALFRASRQSISHAALDPALGWRELAAGGLEIRNIEGNHGSILKEPQVSKLAKLLSEELDAAVEHRAQRGGDDCGVARVDSNLRPSGSKSSLMSTGVLDEEQP